MLYNILDPVFLGNFKTGKKDLEPGTGQGGDIH